MARLQLTDEDKKTVPIPRTVTVRKPVVQQVTQPVSQPVTQPVSTSDVGIIDAFGRPPVPVAEPRVDIPQAVPTGPTFAQMQAMLAQQRERARIAELEKARQASLSALRAEKETIEPQFAEARRQTRATSARGAQQFADFLAGRGLSAAGGAALGETRRLGALQGALGGLAQQETAALGDIARRRTGIEAGFASDVEAARAGIQAEAMQTAIEQQRLDEAARLAEQQRAFENAIARAGLTGMFEGEQTLLGQQFADNATKVQQDLELGRINLEEAQLRLERLRQPAPVATRPTTGEAVDPATGITFKQFDEIADLYKTNPGLAQSYVQSLNLPNYQFNQLMASLQQQPTAPREITPTGYKTDPDFAEDLAQIINAAPDQKVLLEQQLRANAQAFITKYGVEGYNALLAEAAAF